MAPILPKKKRSLFKKGFDAAAARFGLTSLTTLDLSTTPELPVSPNFPTTLDLPATLDPHTTPSPLTTPEPPTSTEPPTISLRAAVRRLFGFVSSTQPARYAPTQ